VPEQHDGGDQARKRDQRQRDTAMKSPCFRARPGVERAHQFSAVVGIGANRLGRAVVAYVRARSVAGDAELVVELTQMQVLSLRTLPGVEVGVEAEAAGPVAVCARMRVAREQIEHDGGRDQAAAVDRCQHDLGVEPAHVIPADRWSERAAKLSFWSLNLRLAWMCFATLLPLGLLQLYESVNKSY